LKKQERAQVQPPITQVMNPAFISTASGSNKAKATKKRFQTRKKGGPSTPGLCSTSPLTAQEIVGMVAKAENVVEATTDRKRREEEVEPNKAAGRQLLKDIEANQNEMRERGEQQLLHEKGGSRQYRYDHKTYDPRGTPSPAEMARTKADIDLELAKKWAQNRKRIQHTRSLRGSIQEGGTRVRPEGQKHKKRLGRPHFRLHPPPRGAPPSPSAYKLTSDNTRANIPTRNTSNDLQKKQKTNLQGPGRFPPSTAPRTSTR